MIAVRLLAVACAMAVAAVAPASATATITITSQGGSIDPEVFATTDGSDGGGVFVHDAKTIPNVPGPATASVSGSPPPAAASSSIGSAHASANSTLSVSSTVSQTTGMVFTSTMTASDAASTHRDTADSQAARRLGATAGEEGGSSMRFTIDVPMDYTLSGGLTNSVNVANPDSDASSFLQGPSGIVEHAQTGQAVGGSGLLPAGNYSLVSSAFLNVGAGEPSAQGGSLSASGTVGFDVTLTLTPAVDSDGDGLPNSWETSGVDSDGDGTVDVDLPAMGADPNHKDIFIEIDAMAGHELGNAAVDDVVLAFDSAPVSNPDGSTGIALHVDNGADSEMDPTTGALWGAQSRHEVLAHQQVLGTETSGGYHWAAFDALKAAHFDPDRRPVFHYVVAAHQYGSATQQSSGISRGFGASDLIVSLGFCVAAVASDCPNGEKTQAGTLMHELGHNLGLHHGGSDDLNYKPVYLSIMNYAFQFSWLPKADGTDVLDYSRFNLTVDENALDENAGFGAPAGSGAAAFDTIFSCPGKKVLAVLTTPVPSLDLNCNGVADGRVAADINDDGALTPLTGPEDWPVLSYKNGGVGSLGAPVFPATTPEIEPPVTELEADRAIVDAGLQATAIAPVIPPANPRPGPTTAIAPPPPAPRTKCTLRPSSSSIALRGAKRGRLTITARCNGVATLKLRAKVTSGRRIHRKLRTATVSLTAGSVRAQPNKTVTIKFTLPRKTVSALTRGDKTSASVTLQVTSASGTSTMTTKIAHLTAQRRH